MRIRLTVRATLAIFLCIALSHCAYAPHGQPAKPDLTPRYTIGLGPRGAALQLPQAMVECEANACGSWDFTSPGSYNAYWPNGSWAALTIERFDTGGIVIHRNDTTGSTQGLTAVYAGTMAGDKLQGQVVWSWPGHWKTTKQSQFTATITSARQLVAMRNEQQRGQGAAALGLMFNVMTSSGAGAPANEDEAEFNRLQERCTSKGDSSACQQRDIVRERMYDKGEQVPATW